MHALSDNRFAATQLAKLSAADIERWRSRLPDRMAPATQNRLLGDLRAALNAAAEKYRRELPAHIAGEIKVGTRALSVPLEDRARKQFLNDDEVRRIIEAAFAIDEDGDFGRLVLLAAVTGARYSQLTALNVADLQLERGRVLVPGSKKGRSARAKPKQPVPLSAGAITRLKPAIEGRKGGEPLLMRWAYEKGDKPTRWRRSHRRAWGPAYELNAIWPQAVAKAELPDGTIMYALRHSSILRGLKAGLPVRLVAAQHDTSSGMVEAFYSAFITDATEDLLRKASLELAGGPAAGDGDASA
jgi:integrase